MTRLLARQAARAAALLSCGLLALSGCGGDDDENSGGPAVTVKANSTIEVVGDEYFFKPGNVVVQGAGKLTIALKNEGSLAHNLHLIKNGEDIGGTPTFTSGKTRSGVVNVEHGTYEMICTVGNHADLGMKGKLEVK